MKSKKLYYAASIALALCLAGSASAVNYSWSGLGDGTTWSQGANWVGGVVPPSGAVQIAIGTGFPTTSPLPITIGASDTISLTDQLFGPEWGQTLNISGSVTAGFGFAPVGAVGGPKSVVNMFGNSSYTSGDSIFIGDMFWFAGGPNVTMNMYDNSKLNTKYLALGGHLNLYGGTVTITNGFLIGSPNAGFWGGVSSDVTRRINLVAGKLILPTGFTTTVTDLIARGVFQSYGKLYDTNDMVITDDGINTVVTNILLGGSLQSVFIQPLYPTNLVAGTFQQAKLLGNYPNVTNVLLSSSEPGVIPATLPGSGVITFTSGNTNIFTVTSGGLLSAINPGSATLKAVLGTYTNIITVTVTPATATLIHQYSFSESSGSTAADSKGGAAWNGTLTGSAVFSATGQVALDGSVGSAVQLPAGIVSNLDIVTIEAWATFPSEISSNANLFAFGDTDLIAFDPNYGFGANYITLSPHTGTTNVQANFGIGLPGSANERDAVMAGVLDNRTNVQIVAVFNPLAGYVALYINGVSVATYNNLAYFLFLENSKPSPLAATLGADPLNYIGQSLNVGDPGLLANIDEFRIYNGPLSAAQIAADHALGPNQLIGTSTSVTLSASLSGGSLVIKWPTTSALVNLMSTPALGSGAVWTHVNGTLVTDGSGKYQMTIPIAGSAQFFRLQQ